MIYLESFSIPTRDEEDSWVLSFPRELELPCYNVNITYPFRVFGDRAPSRLEFSSVTLFSGGNGSGKSTLLNVIAEKLGISRSSPFGAPKCMPPYLDLCSYTLAPGVRRVPSGSAIVTSDDVFDFLLHLRSIGEGVARDRERVYEEYKKARLESYRGFDSMEDLEQLRRSNEAKRGTSSRYIAARVPKDLSGKSNGESAFAYFTKHIGENAIFILDEPENSLSPRLQQELAAFLEDSVRFFGCQLIISTHSPFLLAMKDALIYELGQDSIRRSSFSELEALSCYRELFCGKT